ncbi:MAG: FtsX-like permease family protein [Clostridia bacterium]|nr:FtsX-like permease family protein [Clostridia bacterium]
MSGGQMQRVAIARALVNDPDILLADEPTGALDTETSVAIMEILRKISKDRLIIMVTHNPELAEEYSTRIVRLLDGQITDDSNPVTEDEIVAAEPVAMEKAKAERAKGKKSMSFFTALSLSFNNLMTKRGRTLLTSFAGSIGIIGIALILAVSTGVNAYIASIQRDTLSAYPISILHENTDLSAMFGNAAQKDENAVEHENDAVYSSAQMYEMFNTLFRGEKKQNNLTAFKAFLDKEMKAETATTALREYVSTIQYRYNIPLYTYVQSQFEKDKYVSTDLSAGIAQGSGAASANQNMYNSLAANLTVINLWSEMLPGNGDELISSMVKDQYDLVYGAWPTTKEEIVLIVDDKNEVSDLVFYALGYKSTEEITQMLSAFLNEEELPIIEVPPIQYEDICSISFKLLLPSDFYSKNEAKSTEGKPVFDYMGDNETYMQGVLKNQNTLSLRISGIVRQNEEVSGGAISTPFAYTSALTEYLIEENNKSEIVKAQSDPANENYDVLTGLPFFINEENKLTDAVKAEKIKAYFASPSLEEKVEMYITLLSIPQDLDEQVATYTAMYGATVEDMKTNIMKFATENPDMLKEFDFTLEQLGMYLNLADEETLKGFFTQSIAAMIIAQERARVEKNVEMIMNTPSDADLDAIIGTMTYILENPSMIPAALGEVTFPDIRATEGKMAYILADWSTSVSMKPEDIMAHLATLSADELEATFRASLAKSYAVMKETDMIAQIGAFQGFNLTESKLSKVSALFDGFLQMATEEMLVPLYDTYMPAQTSSTTLEDNMEKLGIVSEDTPSAINIYSTTFENKDKIAKIISGYNARLENDNDKENDKDIIEYTDYIAMLLSGVTKIINAISYVLIAFVSISLVVSSIMIGIITYISVLERTKEIGILRAIGASKRDVSRVFNAETFIVGLGAGLIGIGISLLLCIPINIIIHALSGVTNLSAFLEPLHMVTLVAISMGLTVVAGLIPSRMAAKKDPVEALRSE